MILLLGSLLILSACQNQPLGPDGKPQNNLSADQLKAQADQTSALLKLQDQLNKVILTKNINNCAEIKDQIYFTSCNVHILANRAVEENKPDACSGGTTDEIKQTCLAYYNQAIEAAKTAKEAAATVKAPALTTTTKATLQTTGAKAITKK